MTVEPPAVRRRPVYQHDIDWAPIVDTVRWMPAEHRLPTVDEPTAMRILRCTPRSFAALREHGLTPANTSLGLRYDANDIRNAALYSRSGHTEVEVAMGSILSFLRGGDEELFGARRWVFELVGLPADADTCLLYPPRPEAFGGESGPLETDSGMPARLGDRVPVPAGTALRGSMTTRGRPESIVAPAIRVISEEFLAGGVRWHHLSPGLKTDADAAFARGVGNCDTLCAVLAARLREAGFDARVYRSWIIGITAVPHSHIEVVDGDRRTKVVDPSLLLLADHTILGSREFAARAFGAPLSRIAPTRCELDSSIGMTPAGATCEVRFSCRSVGGGTSR